MHVVFGMGGHTVVIRRAFEQYHGQVLEYPYLYLLT